MTGKSIDDILQRLNTLHKELEAEIDQLLQEKRKQFRYNFRKGKVRFEKSMRALQKSYRVSSWHYLKNARLQHILSAPFIYSLIIPFTLLDIFVSFYQQLCFRLFDIPLVKRKDYIVIDRHNLAYLNMIEKINCVYCGYGNGLIAYTREIAARTEQYWCPIKHASRTADPHRFNQGFVEYGDAESYQQKLNALQQEIRELDKNHAD